MTTCIVASAAAAIAGIVCGWIGEHFGRRMGIIEGYAAVEWPDSPYFANARAIINAARSKAGLATIEQRAENRPTPKGPTHDNCEQQR